MARHPPAPGDMAQVVRRHARALEERHGLPPGAHRVLGAIASCRTAALGGQLYACEACGAARFVYHSCRDRHCPKCQTLAKERWLAQRVAELLPVPYFHVVFTLPHALNTLVPWHPRLIYGLLFAAAAQTLLTFGHRNLGGRIGVTLVLHTWAQDLTRHVHVHAVVTGGALRNDGTWGHSRPDFLFPVKALSKVFRGKYLHALRQAREAGQIRDCAWTHKPAAWADFLRRLRQHDWVVYAKRPFAGPRQVLDYLGRYTHRVAIANHRILHVDEDIVAFRCRPRTDQGKRRHRVIRLSGPDFLQRFLLHLLPPGLKRIRHYGLTASRCKKDCLATCRTQLNVPPPEPVAPETTEEFMQRVADVDVRRCPECHAGRVTLIAILPALTRNPEHCRPFATGPPGRLA